MIHIDRMIDEMNNLEADLLMPFDVSLLENYWFAMDKINDNGNWLGYICHKDGDEFAIAYNASKGVMKYQKQSPLYKQFVNEAKIIFPLDSCANNTMSTLLVLCESRGWDEVEDE